MMISYSIAMSLSILIICLFIGDLNYKSIQYNQTTSLFYVLLPVSIMFILSCVAELARCPFDLIEAESELVAGQMTEYSAVIFSYFFLAEYSMMLFMGIFLT